jgi:hypothetical protein
MTSLDRTVRWVGHRWWILLALTLVQWVTPSIPGWLTLPEGVRYLALAAWTGAFLLTIYAAYQHERALCPDCLGAMPLDPAEEVERKRRWLRAMHWLVESRWRLSYVICAYSAVGFVVSWILPRTILIPVVWFAVLIVTLNRLTDTHRTLQPWCPWCRRGKDNDEEVVEPQPDPAMGRS